MTFIPHQEAITFRDDGRGVALPMALGPPRLLNVGAVDQDGQRSTSACGAPPMTQCSTFSMV